MWDDVTLDRETENRLAAIFAAPDEQLYAEYGRSVAAGAAEIDPEEEGRKRFPGLLAAARASVCADRRIKAFIAGGASYEGAHAAAIVCDILLHVAKVTSYSGPSAAVLCVRYGLHKLCGAQDAGNGL
jgi:hypothetical protein